MRKEDTRGLSRENECQRSKQYTHTQTLTTPAPHMCTQPQAGAHTHTHAHELILEEVGYGEHVGDLVHGERDRRGGGRAGPQLIQVRQQLLHSNASGVRRRSANGATGQSHAAPFAPQRRG